MALSSYRSMFHPPQDRFISDKVRQNGQEIYWFSQLVKTTTIPVKNKIFIRTSSGGSWKILNVEQDLDDAVCFKHVYFSEC